MHVQTYVCSKEYALYNGAYSTCSGLTHLNLLCEDVFESVNVDQGELRSVGQGGRVDGRRRDKRRKVTITHVHI